MKIIYCIRAIYNPGGMERVLLNKVAYLTKYLQYEILIVTTDQQGRPPFYPFPANIRMIDLGIDYADDNDKNVCKKIAGYLRRRKIHKRRLAALLQEEKADIVVSLYPSESSFLPTIKDGSKKVLELHFCKFFRIQYRRKGLLGWIDKWRTLQDESIVRKFDKFVVLTHEDHKYWGQLPNIEVIPNAAMNMSSHFSDVASHRVIAVGRLDYQKGFDRLIHAWELIQKNSRYGDWNLDIFGQGEWYDMLQDMIINRGLEKTAHIHQPTNNIGYEYAHSSLIVMTSNYEGFGMVLVEAMACGVPAVAFDCKCGPRDIIRQGENGLLVPNGDIQRLADAMMEIMGNDAYRRMLSQNARKVVSTYSEKVVMDKWVRLFTSLVGK